MIINKHADIEINKRRRTDFQASQSEHTLDSDTLISSCRKAFSTPPSTHAVYGLISTTFSTRRKHAGPFPAPTCHFYSYHCESKGEIKWPLSVSVSAFWIPHHSFPPTDPRVIFSELSNPFIIWIMILPSNMRILLFTNTSSLLFWL